MGQLYIITFCLKSWYSFRVVDGGYIKALSYRHKHIIQDVDLETPFNTLELVDLNGMFPHFRQ